MHVTHLADQIIATRFVLGPAIPPKGSAGTSFVRLARLAADLSNSITQQSPSAPAKYVRRVQDGQ